MLHLQFAELYENNGMFDKFTCAISGDGKQIATGTYGNQMRIIQQEGAWPEKTETIVEASRDPLRRRHAFPPKVCLSSPKPLTCTKRKPDIHLHQLSLYKSQ